MSSGMSMDSFLRHSAKGNGRKNFLKNWKDSPEHAITVWLSMRTGIMALWRHPWTRVVPREERSTGNKTREVWSDKLMCFEHEDVLKVQHWRDKSTGKRDLPPQLCPHCKMIEHVRQAVDSGEMKWTQPLFRFEGTDPRATKIIHAGGLYNAFGNKDLTKEQKDEMARVPQQEGGPIYAREAWKQNSMAKLEYAFCVVDNDDAEKGLQIAVEASLLGDKVKHCIAHAKKSLDDGHGGGDRLGNPLVTPYAIRWEFNPADGIEFGKKYDAIRMEKVRLRPAVEKLIRDTDPPDMSALAERFNLETHRANLERHCLVKLPFDEFFAAARAAKKVEQEKGPERMPDVRTDSFPGDDVGHQSSAPVPEAPAASAPPSNEMFGCDDCGALMRGDEIECKKCGKIYEVVAAPAPPPKPLRKRSAAPQVTAPTPSPSAAPVDPAEDDLPF